MNSLTNFDHMPVPLHAYFNHMQKYAVKHSCIEVIEQVNCTVIKLPNGKCSISIKEGAITVNRIGFDYDNTSVYTPQTVDEAKHLIGILSGVCYEHGCTRKESDDSTYLMIKILNSHTF